MKRARVIYNPTSGREEAKRMLPDLLDQLEMAGYEASAHATKGKDDATVAARTACERGYDLIVASGGDGTLYEVINGMADHPNRPPLGIIPSGTTNDFASAIGIPKKSDEAIRFMLEGTAQPIDIGKMNDRYFINIAGGGSLTTLTYEVPIKLKTLLGQMAYYVKGIEMLPKLKPTMMRIEADNFLLEEEIMLFLVANSQSVGGFPHLAPNASLNDGLLDAILLKKTNLAEAVRLAAAALRGEHPNDPSVIYFQTSYLKAASPNEVLVNLDGELGGALPCEIHAMPSHIQVLMKKDLSLTAERGATS
ncbi:diacylglycerol kinase [Rubeoparvulum massiliense]|uniref:diacylglycerol kinase n=1 Tax=Rubeoparvulum massiliense TaxID=1631346 RepID=UPI00065E8E1A|nr:diacylglycerol kinase [Rubeoparvulum massiliense]